MKTEKSIRFQIPSLPSSINQIYAINFGQRHIFLRPEVKRWKTDMKVYIPKWKPSDTGYIRVDIDIYSNWFYKNGKVKRADLQNLEKVLIDTICEKIGIDDKFIFYKNSKKIQADEDRIDVQMSLAGMENTISGVPSKLPEARTWE